MLQGIIAPHSMPSVQGSSECSGYEPARLERPMWQLQAVIIAPYGSRSLAPSQAAGCHRCLAGWGLAAWIWGSVHLLFPSLAASHSHQSPAAAAGLTRRRPLRRKLVVILASSDVVESQRLGRDVCRGNSTQNPALSRCPRLVQLFQRCWLSLMTMFWLHFWNTLGSAARQKTQFESGRSKICEDMLSSRQQQQLCFPQKHLCYHWRCVLEMATTIRGQFKAPRTARAVVHNTKRSLAASFARDTPPCSSDLQLLMNPFYCWRHSRLA